MDLESVARFFGRYGFAVLVVGIVSTGVGKLLTREKTFEHLWNWSDAIAWTMAGLGVALCILGISGLANGASGAYAMALGTVLGFLGLFWVVWW